MIRRFRVGVQLSPQHTAVADLRRAWRHADRMGVDSIWTWDHFFPLTAPRHGSHFEGWSLLAAMAVDTEHAALGMLVTANPYRNPDLLADMARTVDHLSGGRLYLGIGAGWFARDFDEYGYDFADVPGRLRSLRASLPRIKARLRCLDPPPLGRLPILVGGGGERVTLRLTAEHADAWNSFGPARRWARKNQVLDAWCAEVGRDPQAIERTVLLNGPSELDELDDFVAAGVEHVILTVHHPFDLAPIGQLLDAARSA